MTEEPPHQFETLHGLFGRLRHRRDLGLRPWDRLSDPCRRCYLPRISHPTIETVPARSKHHRV